MALLTLVRPSFYQDSVALLALARELRARPDVSEAAALMGTPANRELLAQAGLLTAEAAAAGPNDLVVVIDAAPAAALPARARAEELLSAQRARREHGVRHAPRTIDGAPHGGCAGLADHGDDLGPGIGAEGVERGERHEPADG